MPISLKHRFKQFKAAAIDEFYLHINDLLEENIVQELDNHIQHCSSSRLKHSIDVAYTSFIIAKLFRWDARSTARGGLLHDLYLYDWREKNHGSTNHASHHPKVALDNARTIASLNVIEEDIIVKHMWLVTLTPPKYKEGFIVTFVDKYCAVREFITGVVQKRTEKKAAKSEI